MVTVLQELNPRVSSVPAGGPFSPTEERILTAGLGLIGRRGVRRLGMREIAETAGVSRGTLYRYFPSKDHVLAAAAAYDAQRFSDGLDQVLAAARSPEQRISAFMAYAFDFIRTHPCRPLFESESGFVMSYLLDHLPALRDELLRRLGDALDTVPAVAAGTLDQGPAGRRHRPPLRVELDHPRDGRRLARAVSQPHPADQFGGDR